VLEFAGVAGEGDVMLILNIPEQKKYIPGGEVSKESAERFARRFIAGEIEGVSLR
jgi:hypothetical protein